MKKYLMIISCIFAVIIPSISCSTTTGPSTTAPIASEPDEPAVIEPVIKGILGDTEWAPSSEGTLSSYDNDDKAGKLTYSWSAEKGTIKGEGKQVTWIAPDTVGDYKITVTATTAQGDQTSRTRTLHVLENPYGRNAEDTSIYLKLAIPSYLTVEESKRAPAMSITDIQCTVSGADPKELTYTWTTTGGKLMGEGIEEGTADRVGWLAPGTPGLFTLSVTVSDKSGHTSTGKVNFNVYIAD